MLTPVANIHHSKLPTPGAIVRLAPRLGHGKRRFIVEAFNLCDSADPRYSRGIHLVHLRALRNGARVTVAGHWCEEE